MEYSGTNADFDKSYSQGRERGSGARERLRGEREAQGRERGSGARERLRGEREAQGAHSVKDRIVYLGENHARRLTIFSMYWTWLV
jgi:hypothetical protein